MPPILKFDFLKIEFQFKTQFLDNQVITNWKFKKKKKKCMELEFLGLEFHAIFLFFLKFDCPILITAFRKPYSDVLNGTRALWTQVPCNFFIFFIIIKFDRPIPIATFKESYSGVLNGTQVLWTRVPCKFLFIYFFLNLIIPYI